MGDFNPGSSRITYYHGQTMRYWLMILCQWHESPWNPHAYWLCGFRLFSSIAAFFAPGWDFGWESGISRVVCLPQARVCCVRNASPLYSPVWCRCGRQWTIS